MRAYTLKSFNVWKRNKEKSAVCMYFVWYKCVCVAQLYVWTSLLWSRAMEHHIVVDRGWDDDCFVCSSSFSVERDMLTRTCDANAWKQRKLG